MKHHLQVMQFKLELISAHLRVQINIEYEKALHERKAVDCRIPNIVFPISSLDGIFPFIKNVT